MAADLRSVCLSTLFLVCLLPAFAYAEPPATPPGVVATVNGQPIMLSQVEACHDVSGDSVLLAQNPSLELLRQQYDACAVSLILNALVEQELHQRQLGITEGDVDKAEIEARADYPYPGDFEKELQDEYLDIDTWREFMRHRLAAQRFQQHVLRPLFTLSKEDFQTYYTANRTQFQIPAQIEVIWFQNGDKAQIEKDRAAWKPEDITDPDLSEDATILRISPDRLSPQLRKDLQSLKFGQPTPIRQEGDVYLFLVPKDRFPAKNLTIVEAYPQIEQALIEERLEEAYMAWLEQTLKSADIRIAPQLRKKIESEKTPASQSTK